MLNKDDAGWFSKINYKLTCIDRTLSPLYLKPINSGMGFKEQLSYYPDQQSYLESKAKAFKANKLIVKLLMIYSISDQHY